MRNASTASERILRSGRSHEYLYQRSDSEHEYRHWLHSGVCILLCPQQRETLAYDDDFADPEFFPGKLKMMEKKRPQNFLLTGMSDLSGWKPEWRDEVFAKIRENPQHQFLFLTKRPDLLDFDTDLENAWFGVTVTGKAELWRIDALRKNVRAKHYHVTFEPLFDDPGTVDLSEINWIVVGTMTGAQSRKIHTEPEWAWSLTDQAHKLGIPVFMKEDLVPIIGDENMIQEIPEEFNKVLEVQKSWKK